jgi:hypothetical protein
MGLLSDTQLGQVGADGIERSSHLVSRGQQVELVRAACAVLQQRRGRIPAGVGMDGIQLDVRGFDVVIASRASMSVSVVYQ